MSASETDSTPLAVHVKARSQENPSYPQRLLIPDSSVFWSTPIEPVYNPPHFTHKVVLANDCTIKPGGWADPPDPKTISEEEWSVRKKQSHEGEMQFNGENGSPMNPRGRTGLSGRGLLGKWGPNFAADPIVTRFKPVAEVGEGKKLLQMVAIRRSDTGAWAIPGGMVDPGETVSQTVQREFSEEAGNLADDPLKAEAFRRHSEQLFQNGRVVYEGYVDDPRNTDNAWMETSAMHFHCSEELGRMLPLHAGDDAAAVAWIDVSDEDERFRNLYASHKDMVLAAAKYLIE
eukprot:CAMPEP_0185727720 /NCGR_PEP_ID=MMETSP1171-20130828/3337_1 /TAXON_ID=374046 /ORGANISM="Helicotheca tamensis, Strain CCMP826" /LENGTH=288 /DNA_ID=CAMNT_0028396349 /DNA_START=182 /DNA_END=1048 /DNA_ORIENTATION=+